MILWRDISTYVPVDWPVLIAETFPGMGPMYYVAVFEQGEWFSPGGHRLKKRLFGPNPTHWAEINDPLQVPTSNLKEQ